MTHGTRPVRLVRALVVALVLAGCSGDEPASAEVNGQTYAVGPARGLRISESDLDHFGSVGSTNAAAYFLNGEVLTLRDVDPATLLLVRSAPALRDDPDDPWGLYVGLWGGGQDANLCSYADASAVSFCK